MRFLYSVSLSVSQGVTCSIDLESLPKPNLKSFPKSLWQNYICLLPISFSLPIISPICFVPFVFFVSLSPLSPLFLPLYLFFFPSYLPFINGPEITPTSYNKVVKLDYLVSPFNRGRDEMITVFITIVMVANLYFYILYPQITSYFNNNHTYVL